MPRDGRLCVPPGVLHTPRNVGQTLSGAWDTRGTAWDESAATRINAWGRWDTYVGQRGTAGVPFAENPWDTRP